MKNPFSALLRSKSHLEKIQDNLVRLRIARASLQRSGPGREVQLVNALQFVTLLLYDCVVLLEDLQRARNGQRQRVYARVFAVLAIDAFEHLGNLLGPFGAELAQITDGAKLEKPLAGARSLLDAARRKHEAFLRDVRNTLIAHTGSDGEDRLRRLEDLDLLRVIGAFTEFLALLEQTQLDLGVLLEASGKASAG